MSIVNCELQLQNKVFILLEKHLPRLVRRYVKTDALASEIAYLANWFTTKRVQEILEKASKEVTP